MAANSNVRRTRLTIAAIAALLSCALAVTFARAAVPDFVDKTAWFQVRTAHFTIFSDSDDLAVAVARRLERLSELLALLHPGLRAHPAVPVHVYVFRDAGGMAAYKWGAAENADAAFLPGDGRFFILMHGDGETPGGISSLFHEYIHAHLAANFPSVPLWVDEGMAQYFSMMRLGREYVEYGLVQHHVAEYMKLYFEHEPLLSFEMLFAVNIRSRAYQRPNPTQLRFYVQSWALTHYLLSGTPEDRAHFATFLEKMRAGTKARQAFEEEFPKERWPKILAELKPHIANARLEAPRRLNFGRLESVEAYAEPLAFAEALFRLGELTQVLGTPEDAADHFKASLALDPSRAAAHAALGFALETSGDSAAADQSYERALASDSKNLEAWVYAGRGVLRRFLVRREDMEVKSQDPLLLTVRDRFRRALQIDPGNLVALAGYGRSQLLEARPDSAAVAGLERAVVAMPGRPDLAADLAFLKARMGRAAEARELIQQRVNPSVSARMTRSVSRAVASADLARAGEMLESGDAAEGESLLVRISRESNDPVTRDAAATRLQDHRERQSIATFNDGVEAANRGAHEEASRLFERAHAETSDPELRREAAHGIARMKGMIAVRRATDLLNRNQPREAKRELASLKGVALVDDVAGLVASLNANADALIAIEGTMPLVRTGKLKEARAKISVLLDTPITDSMRKYVKNRLDQIDEVIGASK